MAVKRTLLVNAAPLHCRCLLLLLLLPGMRRWSGCSLGGYITRSSKSRRECCGRAGQCAAEGPAGCDVLQKRLGLGQAGAGAAVNRVARRLAQESLKGLRALCYRVTRQVAEVLLVAAQALLEVSVGVRV